MTRALLHNRKQDKSQPLSDIFISHEQINIDNCAGINQFRDRTSDLHDNNATGETSTSRSETAVVVTAPLSSDVLPFSRRIAPFSPCGVRRCVRRGCIQKANIPRDVPRDANTYRLFTRRAIFEAIRQSDIWETFVSRRA